MFFTYFTWFCPDYIGVPHPICWFLVGPVGPEILVKLRAVEQLFSGAAVLGPCFPAVQDLVALRQTRAGCEGQTWTDPGMRDVSDPGSMWPPLVIPKRFQLPTCWKHMRLNEIWGLSEKSWWTMPRPEGWPLTICIYLYTILGKTQIRMFRLPGVCLSFGMAAGWRTRPWDALNFSRVSWSFCGPRLGQRPWLKNNN